MTGPKLVYDYYVKDHLGNVRMLLTEEQRAICYPPATVEVQRIAGEKQLYDIQDAGVKNVADVPGAARPSFEQRFYELNGSAGINRKVGLGIALKVMAGDAVNLRVESFYRKPASPDNQNGGIPILQLLQSFVSSGVAAGKGVLSPQDVAGVPGVSSALQPFTAPAPPTDRANAALNWIFFDEQMRFVSGGTNAVAAWGAVNTGVYQEHLAQVTAQKSGYLYVFCANESNFPVFFDNLSVRHTPGPVLEETHYYPFGLTMQGISSKAAGGVENRLKFNKGSELQSKEFSDGSGLDWYATQFRMYDPQLGRWHVVDPKPTHDESLYAAMLNNPILHNDPLGDSIPRMLRAPIQNVNSTAKGFVFGLNGRYQKEPVRGSTVTGIRDTKAGGTNAAGKIKGVDVVRVDQAHGKGKSAIGPHLNINEKVTGVPDPHTRLTSTQFNGLKTAGQALDGIGRVAKPVAIVTDAVQLGDAIKTDIQQGTGGDNTIVTGSRVAGGWGGAALGAAGGAKLGAGIGTFFGPVGTAVGGFVGAIGGGIIGGIYGSKGGEAVGEKIVEAKNED